MWRRVVFPGVLVVGLAAVAMAAAPGGAPWKGWGKFPLADSPLGRMVSGGVGRLLVLRSELNATPEQRGQIRDVLVSRRPQIAQTVKAVHDKRVTLRNAVLSGQANEAQIRAAADALGQAIGDAAVKAVKLRNELAPILTEEQRQLIRQFLAENDGAINKFLEQASLEK